MIQSYNQFLESRKNPCWKGYKQIGTKLKGSRKVPNCVKVNEQEVLDEFDRTAFYLDYYTNLTPSDFKLTRLGNSIIIQVPSE
jgi:hypothetical protein